jgi:hypothetical protein
VWLDVGCGDNLPLTQLVLGTGEAEHVHAIEGNETAYPHIARLLAAKDELRRRVTVHRALSSDVELPPDARGDALVHEVIGVVASDEGMINILADAQERLLVDRAAIFPYFIASVAVPTGPLEVTLATVAAGLFVPGTDIYPDQQAPGLQSVFAPNARWLSETTPLIEEFHFGPDAAPLRDQMQQTTVSKWTVETPGPFAGFLLSCVLEVAPGGSRTDGLRSRTAWGAYFLRMAPPDAEPDLDAGDEVELTFTVDARSIVPEYTTAAAVRRRGTEVRYGPYGWKGPQGKNHLSPFLS